MSTQAPDNMSHLKDQHDEAMEVAEAARETEWKQPSYAAGLFMGRVQPELIRNYPEPTTEQVLEGEAMYEKVRSFIEEHVDPLQVERDAKIPDHVVQGFRDMGCFGLKLPKEYGGLGLSQVYYNKIVALIGSYSASVAVLISAHQSIGVPQPLKIFGTKEQKQKYLPRLAAGAISAFALTEPNVGSDPAKMTATAELTEDGNYYIINGEKLWCTNGTVAELLIVMVRTPDKIVNGKPRKQISAFIVETNSPGFEIVHRCEFIGLRGIENGLLRFKDVKVPKGNLIGKEGMGLKIALTTLNNGRLTLPAACGAYFKQCLNINRDWANERVQWGAPIGKHEAVANKLGKMVATTYAMEAATYYAAGLADSGTADIRLEAAMAKMQASEAAWHAIDETLQIRGGRGYETEQSLLARGEKPYGVERMLRDSRINTIIEGASEIMRLFLAREALDPHMKLGADLINPKSSLGAKIKSFFKSAVFYSWWYPTRWLPTFLWKRHGQFRSFSKHMRFVERASRRLSRNIFHGMMFFQAGLEKRQMFLGRIVEIGAELFTMSAVVSKALADQEKSPNDETPQQLADLYCCLAKRRIQQNFRELWRNDDVKVRYVAQRFLADDYQWLEAGIIEPEAIALRLLEQVSQSSAA